MLYAKRVTVIDPASTMVLRQLSTAAAIKEELRGLIVPLVIRNGFIVHAQPTHTLGGNEARPGSFGIRKQRSETVGTLFFQHKGHYGRAIEQMNEA